VVSYKGVGGMLKNAVLVECILLASVWNVPPPIDSRHCTDATEQRSACKSGCGLLPSVASVHILTWRLQRPAHCRYEEMDLFLLKHNFTQETVAGRGMPHGPLLSYGGIPLADWAARRGAAVRRVGGRVARFGGVLRRTGVACWQGAAGSWEVCLSGTAQRQGGGGLGSADCTYHALC